jgi:hypothetical protein
MPQDRIDASLFTRDKREFIALLHKHQVRYLIVGGEAVIYYGYARLTGDIDFFYGAEGENAHRRYGALNEFWQGAIPGLQDASELTEAGVIVQFGRPPNRIDLLNQIDGVPFDEAWAARREVSLISENLETPAYYLSLEHLVQNKEAAGRPRDLDDLQYLARSKPPP